MKRVALMLAIVACNGSSPTQISDGSTSSGSATTSSSTSSPWPPPTSYDAYGIIDEPDLGGLRCDLWGQDCPPGEKCMPYSNDGGSEPNGSRCSPIAPNPKQPGEPCTVEAAPLSGIDDCDRSAICWDVDPETNRGICREMCEGTDANPHCDEACTVCAVGSHINLCLPNCDPLAQDCGEARGCYPILETFACFYYSGGGAFGVPCVAITDCDPGLHCEDAAFLPDCDGASCCAPFCDLDEPDECDAQIPGSSCFAWFDSGTYADTCYPAGTVGFCAVPP
jgi:hypothetical protein